VTPSLPEDTALRSIVNRRLIVIAALVLAAVVAAGSLAVLALRGGSDDGTALLPQGAVWRYNDGGEDLGIAWRQADFDDAAWPQGPAPLGYGQDVTTQVSYGPDEQDKHLTTYFRASFDLPNSTAGIELRMRRDDGAVVYINGSEVLRSGMPTADVTATTAANYAQDDGEVWIEAELPGSVVAPGSNVVAVEVHQTKADSSDLFFDMEILSLDRAPTLADPAPAGATRVVAGGDIGECGGAAPETAELLEQVQGPFLALGDIAYPKGAPDDYAKCYDPFYGPYKDRTLPVPGNHDYMTDDGLPYFEYFGPAAGSQEQSWYSRDVGDWHIVFLDSNCEFVGGCDEQSPQYQWLTEDLKSAQSKCVAAVWHHPRYSSSQYGDSEEMAPMFNALVAAGGDLVLNGHAHFYERYPRMSGDAQTAESGMREFIVGTGGANLYPFETVNPASEVRWNQGHGLLQLDLGPDGYQWRYLPTDTAVVVDSGSDTC